MPSLTMLLPSCRRSSLGGRRILTDRAQMPRKKMNGELPSEGPAVLRVSLDLKPCPKFCKANLYQFADHLNEGKCEQCLTLHRQWSKELGMMKFLRESRN